MKKDFEAYHSSAWGIVLLSVAIVLFITGLIFYRIEGALLFLEFAAFVFFLVSLFALRNKGLAVEITDNKLILHKKEIVEISIYDIFEVSLHDGYGSFDITVKTAYEKYSMHCFIKNKIAKNKELISLLKSKDIRVSTYDIN